MRLHLATALAAVSLVHSKNQTVATWRSTAFIGEESFATHTVRYGNNPITPVPTTTEPIVLVTSALTEPTASRNIILTTWQTTQVTLAATTRLVTVLTTRVPPTITLLGTATTTVRVTPTLATVTFSATLRANCSAPTPLTTVTKYTGTYTPFPGQPSTLPTLFPTAVTTYFRATEHYKIYPYTGTTITSTSTITQTTYLSTFTAGPTTIDPMDGARGYTRTSHATTVTTTVDVNQIAVETARATATTACEEGATRTVTYHAKCAPTNLIAEREGRGIGIKAVGWMDWTTWGNGFPPISRKMDASECCQLCVDNAGCAASEWRSPKLYDEGGCLLYYWNHGGEQNGSVGKGTCGGLGEKGLEYFGDVNTLPRLGSFIQNGCGEVKYAGGYDPLCPMCKME